MVSESALPELHQAATHLPDITRAITNARRRLSPTRAHLAVEQAQLRQRGVVKFESHAAAMFFTGKGLEQATDPRIAAYKALSLPENACVLDVGPGIGGDAMYMAQRCQLSAIDLDPACVLFTHCNVERVGNSQVQSQQGDGTQADLESFDAWHCDPDRRSMGQRTVRLSQMQPELTQLEEMWQRNPNMMLKLAPASCVEPGSFGLCDYEWIGHSRECLQQVVRSGSLARFEGQHAATVLSRDSSQSARTLVGRPGRWPPEVLTWKSHLVEPHATVLAADLVPALCHTLGLHPILIGLAYLTADDPPWDPLAQAYPIVHEMPFDERRVRQWLIDHDYHLVAVKKRGVSITPESVLSRLRTPSGKAALLFVMKRAHAVVAVVTALPAGDASAS